MIIDSTYFVGELHLSQVGASASALANNNTKLQLAIDEYVPEIMEKALGKVLSDEFFTVVDPITGDIIAGSDVKWTDLMEGTSYDYSGTTYYWQGLRNESGTLPKSLVAYYVYYKYMVDQIRSKSTMGMVRADAENASRASAIPTLTRAWRKLYDWYGSPVCNVYHNRYIHKGVLVNDFSGGGQSKNVSLYTYLKHNEALFPTWEFQVIENKNQWQL